MSDPKPHRLPVRVYPVRVYYEDTDAGGIVYHANYLKYAERARTELLRDAGFDHTSLMADHGAGFAVRRCTLEFIKPAVLDDALVIETDVASLRGASVEMRQCIRRGDQTIAQVDIHVALIDRHGRPMRLPPALAAAMRGLSAPAEA
jgi:acyl-CoA thioester hydrolase